MLVSRVRQSRCTTSGVGHSLSAAAVAGGIVQGDTRYAKVRFPEQINEAEENLVDEYLFKSVFIPSEADPSVCF